MAQNAPPVTKAGKAPVAKFKNDVMDVDVQSEVLADGTTGESTVKGKTSFKPIGKGGGAFWGTPGYSAKQKDGKVVVTKVNGLAFIKGLIRIQTVYGPKSKATQTSQYGRGTTTQDENAGNTSLGFHEACHQADYLNWLKNKSLPEFKGRVGMTKTEFEAAATKFGKDIDAYFKDMKKDSDDKTDEVGYKKSTFKSKGPRK